MQQEMAVDLDSLTQFVRRILATLESYQAKFAELEALKASRVVVSREKNFEDFKAFCKKLGHWEIGQMLDRCTVVRWNPDAPRFKFAAPDWERSSLSFLYKADLVDLLTRYCDGRPPRYVVFAPMDDVTTENH